MNCALGISQLKRIEAILSRREEIARKYNDKLTENENLQLPHSLCRSVESVGSCMSFGYQDLGLEFIAIGLSRR